MKPNAVASEPCGLMVMHSLSEHSAVTIAFLVFGPLKQLISDIRGKLAFVGAALLELFFFHGKVLSWMLYKIK